jgi:hypothetical protein
MLRDALVQAAIDEAQRSIKDGLPGPLQGLGRAPAASGGSA